MMFSGVVAGDACCVSVPVMKFSFGVDLGVTLTCFAVTCEAEQGTGPWETQC